MTNRPSVAPADRKSQIRHLKLWGGGVYVLGVLCPGGMCSIIVVLFLLLLDCYTVLLINGHKTNQCHNAGSTWKNGFSIPKNCMMRNLRRFMGSIPG